VATDDDVFFGQRDAEGPAIDLRVPELPPVADVQTDHRVVTAGDDLVPASGQAAVDCDRRLPIDAGAAGLFPFCQLSAAGLEFAA
jgi:hypothetical protein